VEAERTPDKSLPGGLSLLRGIVWPISNSAGKDKNRPRRPQGSGR